jgi:hypothetical protein
MGNSPACPLYQLSQIGQQFRPDHNNERDGQGQQMVQAGKETPAPLQFQGTYLINDCSIGIRRDTTEVGVYPGDSVSRKPVGTKCYFTRWTVDCVQRQREFGLIRKQNSVNTRRYPTGEHTGQDNPCGSGLLEYPFQYGTFAAAPATGKKKHTIATRHCPFQCFVRLRITRYPLPVDRS